MSYENYDPSFPDQPVVDMYLQIWARLPAFRHKPAFIWAEDGAQGPSFLTYAQLNSAVHSISSSLSQSLHKGDTVVILCEPGLELVEIIFACQRAGLIAVPVTPPHLSLANNHNHHLLVRVLSQTKPCAALATRSYIRAAGEYSSCASTRLSKLLEQLRWIATEDLTEQSEHHETSGYEGCRVNEVYLIQYTSGATGIPKPVLVTAGAAAHNVRAARRSYDLHPNSMIASWLPQYHDCGLMFLLLTIVSGATCVLTSPSAFVTRPRMWLEMITEYKATCTPVPSFALPLVVRRGGGTSGLHLETLKNLIIINEPIIKPSIDEFVRVFLPLGLNPSCISPSYGLAENCTFVSTAWRSGGSGGFPIHKNLLPSAKLPTSREEVLEEDIEIMVVDEETHEPVDDGVEGEIWISSPGTALGYLDHPSLTREVFNSRLRDRVAGCYVRTSDRGVVAGKERYLYVMGRCSDVIKGAVHPHYVEKAAYGSCPRLLRPGCLAAFEHQGVVMLVAEVLKPELENNALVSVCEGIRSTVWEEERVEVGVVVLARSRSVPKTTSGKVMRWAARYAFERDELKEVVRVIFGEDGCKSTVFGERVYEQRVRERTKDRAVVEEEEERQGILLAGNRLSLQSSL
ncbi:long-chain-fatty-acid--AMP ligase FadD26-like [Salvia hispanica]|uniref:long-chain-fatty-acid--AMP ligase FadD26-like n=1 Tax=Salvia hispanica TaxID=49212 RepID=UPI002009A4DE|nr:long-chain-fatty-acid--AMP ligase FadD26-like [Salvia hispanica]